MTPEGRVKRMFSAGLQRLQTRYPSPSPGDPAPLLKYWMPVLRGMGQPMLDYVICCNGRFFMVETKRDGEHDLTPRQKKTARDTKAAGGHVFIVNDEKSCEETLRILEGYLHGGN